MGASAPSPLAAEPAPVSGVLSPPARGARVAPYALLGVSVVLTIALSGRLLPQLDPITWLALGLLVVTAAALRRWTDQLADHSGPARIAFWATVAVVGLMVLISPLFGLYGFLGYAQSTRALQGAEGAAGLTATALLCSFAQTGGIATGTVLWGMWAAFFAVNLVIAAAMLALQMQQQRTYREAVAVNMELRQAQARAEELRAQVAEQARLAGVMQERSRLAREIHDTIAQDLIAVIALLSVAGGEQDPQRRQQHLRGAEQTARGALAEARRSVRALSSPRLDDDDLPSAVRRLLEAWSGWTGLEAQFEVTGTPWADAADEAALRITQEALMNVGRHARATAVRIELTYEQEQLTVRISDDGRGFNPDQDRAGHGLPGMRERAADRGGRLTIASAAGSGTTVTAILPRATR